MRDTPRGLRRLTAAIIDAVSAAARGRGCSSMVEHQLPKLTVRVRFSSPAPFMTCINAGQHRERRFPLIFPTYRYSPRLTPDVPPVVARPWHDAPSLLPQTRHAF